MNTSLILKNADFSESGFYSPIINWTADLSSELTLPAVTRLAAPMGEGLDVAIFTGLAGKKVRYIQFRLDTSMSIADNAYPSYLNFYDYTNSNLTCTKIGETVRYTINSNSEKSIMTIDLGQEYLITNGLGVYGFDAAFGDRDFSVICGMTLDTGTSQVVMLKNVTGSLSTLTGTDTFIFNNCSPDAKFGISAV